MKNKIILELYKIINSNDIFIKFEKRETPDFYENNEEIEYINIYSLTKNTDKNLHKYIDIIYDYLEEKEEFSIIVDSFYYDWVLINEF